MSDTAGELRLEIPTADAMREAGMRLGRAAMGGDLIMLDGPLGAGKTTLTQGIAAGMGIAGRVNSPTFVIAMVHRNRAGGPDLVHVDAYRLESLEELDALDLDAHVDESVTVIEWGAGKTEVLANDRLGIAIVRPEGAEAGLSVEDLYEDAARTLVVTATGPNSARLLEALRSEG